MSDELLGYISNDKISLEVFRRPDGQNYVLCPWCQARLTEFDQIDAHLGSHTVAHA